MGVHVDPEWDTGAPVGSIGKTIRIDGHPAGYSVFSSLFLQSSSAILAVLLFLCIYLSILDVSDGPMGRLSGSAISIRSVDGPIRVRIGLKIYIDC